MHIAEGMLSGSPEGIAVLAAGAAVTAAGTAWGLRKTSYEQVPQVAMLASAFFVVSLVPIPLGGVSVHLVLNGLVGLVLGWSAFPAILIALLLQAVLFGHGGLTTLGINTASMALPAVAAGLAFRSLASSRSPLAAALAGIAAGATGVMLGAAAVSLTLILSGRDFRTLAEGFFLLHIPLAAVEGAVTGSAVAFVRKVRPELLNAPLLAPSP
ncbi:MAG: cobalt transporter CbiM [Thermoguttaceae bacterium]|nr:cobalt transporter CbiM [Thermoguttaceae bacterium]